MPEQNSYPRAYLYRRIVQSKLFIDNHFFEAIDLGDIAGESYFSRFHFIRLFKAAYGRTPHQYLVQVRIANAKLLLQAGKPVAEACFSVGFDSLTSFTGLFKRKTGSTPAAYREQCLETKADTASAPLKYIPGCFATANGG